VKYFLIKYQFKTGTEGAWHRQIASFIAAVESDPELKGKLSYRCMKQRGSANYFHIVAADDDANGILQKKGFFKPYTEETKRVSGGTVEVLPLDMIAGTTFVA
jgi:hypothetical protein